MVGALKCPRWPDRAAGSGTQTLTIVNTASSSRAVVPDSAATTVLSDWRRTTTIRPSARTVVNTIAAHGVRRSGSTLPRAGGSTSWLAMP